MSGVGDHRLLRKSQSLRCFIDVTSKSSIWCSCRSFTGWHFFHQEKRQIRIQQLLLCSITLAFNLTILSFLFFLSFILSFWPIFLLTKLSKFIFVYFLFGSVSFSLFLFKILSLYCCFCECFSELRFWASSAVYLLLKLNTILKNSEHSATLSTNFRLQTAGLGVDFYNHTTTFISYQWSILKTKKQTNWNKQT